MKFLVITYTREINPGTFLQGFSVNYILKQVFNGVDIDFIKHKRLYSIFEGKEYSGKGKKSFWIPKLMALPRRVKYEILYMLDFKYTKRSFDFFDYSESAFQKLADDYDCVFVGSDTILVSLSKGEQIGLMWLLGVKSPKVLFAASAAPASYSLDDVQKITLKKSFESFSRLYVRDGITYDLLKKSIGVDSNVLKIPDPTYALPSTLFAPSIYFKIRVNLLKQNHKGIVLVNFSGFEHASDLVSLIKQFGFAVISTHYNKDADYNAMSLSPFQWAAMFPFLSFTVTDRFHDSVFSLRNNKPVWAIDWDFSRVSETGSKTHDLLSDYGLDEFYSIVTSIENYKKFKDKFVSWIQGDKNFDVSAVNERNQQCYKSIMRDLNNIF